ncbi:MAG: hypothetical protein ABI895_17710 [Deltaproteobacteria bacterium]
MARRIAGYLLLGGYLAASLPARAGNDDEIFVGNQAAMSGGAVSATVSDSSATWYNPAGLGSVGSNEIDVSGTCYTLRAYSAPRFIASASGQADSASVVEFVSVPAQIAYVRRLGPRLSLGLGYFVPQASSFVLRESLELHEGSRETVWQVALHEVRAQHTAAIGLGMRLSPSVRFGFSLVGTYQEETESLSVVALQGPAADPERLREHFASLTLLGTGTHVGLEAGVGFQIELTPGWRLALTARSARLLVYQLLTVSRAQGVATVAGDGSRPGRIQAQIAEPSIQRTRFDAIRAGRLNLAVARLGTDGDWLALEADIQPGVDAASAGIQRRAVLNARLGLYHRLNDSMAVGAGLFTDRSPERLHADPLSSSGDFYGGSLGWQHDSRHQLGPDEPSDSLSFSTTLALRYAFSRGRLNNLSVDPAAPESLSGQRGRLLVHELGFYVGGGLSF